MATTATAVTIKDCPKCGQGHIFLPGEPMVCDMCGADMGAGQ